MPAKLLFQYPFEGHPSPVPMQGLFSFSPWAYLKLFGMGRQSDFEENGLGNVFRRLHRQTDGPRTERSAAKTLNELLDKLPLEDGHPPLIEDLRLAMSGCSEARQRLAQVTSIEFLLAGLRIEREEWERRHYHQVLMEREGLRAQKMVDVGDAAAAVEYISEHPLLSALLWPEAIEAWRSAPIPTVGGLLPITASMALEAHLGWLAACDIDDAENRKLPTPQFAMLLPSTARPGRNATSLLFDELKRRVGASTVAQLLDKGNGAPCVEIGTLYRWSSGKHFPDAETMSTLMESHGLLDRKDILYRQYTATRIINLLGYLGQTIASGARERGEPAALWPWPAYPFGYPDFESWVANRYPYWLAFHRENGANLAELAKATPANT